MTKYATSMDKVYDVFAEQTKKQYKLYELKRPRKTVGIRPSNPLQEPANEEKQKPETV
jgi:hypothetical protein